MDTVGTPVATSRRRAGEIDAARDVNHACFPHFLVNPPSRQWSRTDDCMTEKSHVSSALQTTCSGWPIGLPRPYLGPRRQTGR